MDEYPTTENLEFIKNFDIVKNPITDLLDYIEEIWWTPSFGFHRETSGELINLQLSTGGWSGNEDIIRALQDNFFFWSLYWVMSKRGGHYWFEISQIKNSK